VKSVRITIIVGIYNKVKLVCITIDCKVATIIIRYNILSQTNIFERESPSFN